MFELGGTGVVFGPCPIQESSILTSVAVLERLVARCDLVVVYIVEHLWRISRTISWRRGVSFGEWTRSALWVGRSGVSSAHATICWRLAEGARVYGSLDFG